MPSSFSLRQKPYVHGAVNMHNYVNTKGSVVRALEQALGFVHCHSAS